MKLFFAQTLAAIWLSGFSMAGEFTRERFARIDSIRISEMSFKPASLDRILFFLVVKIESLDTTPGGPHRMSFIEAGFKGGQREPLADYAKKKVTLKEALGDLSRIYGVTLHATSIGVVVTPKGAKPFPNYKAKEGEVFHTYSNTQGEPAAPSEGAKPSK